MSGTRLMFLLVTLYSLCHTATTVRGVAVAVSAMSGCRALLLLPGGGITSAGAVLITMGVIVAFGGLVSAGAYIWRRRQHQQRLTANGKAKPTPR